MTHEISPLVRGAYDLQKLRIQTGLRLVANIRAKLGLSNANKDDTEDYTKAQKFISEIKRDYARLSAAVADRYSFDGLPFTNAAIISNSVEFVLVNHYIELEQREEELFMSLEKELKQIPVYYRYLKDVRGIGPAMAGVIISEIDITRTSYPSQLWAYAGLDVALDGKGRSRRSEHLVERTYTARDGKEKTKMSITFCPFLKTKLIGVVGPSFLKSKSEFSRHYYRYKERISADPNKADWTKKHIHNAAVRYMVKQFLVDLYMHWREIEGLSTAEPYNYHSESEHHA